MNRNHHNFENSTVIKFLVSSSYRVFRHLLLLLWLFLMFTSANFINEYADGYKWFILFTVYLTFVAMIYFNMYVLVPRFFFRGKLFLYLILLLILGVAGLYFLIHFIGNSFEEYHLKIIHRALQVNEYVSSINIIILFILITTTIKLLQRWIIDSDRMSELKTLTLNLELNELKNQITPHFLFNMLNNIKALIRNDPEKATDIIVKLSDLLRYQLYESNTPLIQLNSKIRFLNNFLSLERNRRDHFDFAVRVNDYAENFSNIEIPPNLFMPFVENAIKHSTDTDNKKINISIMFFVSNKEITFSCINTVPNVKYKSYQKYSGLGLKNIIRRLQLLYNENEYKLETMKDSNNYTVNLTIPL